MDKKKLDLLALHAISLAESKGEVALKLTDEEAEYFLRILDRTCITWASGRKPSEYVYSRYGRGRILWITKGNDFLKNRLTLSYSDHRAFLFDGTPLRPSDMKQQDNFRRYV